VLVIALCAIWLALRRPAGPRLETIDERLARLDERLSTVLRPRGATEAALGRAIGDSLDLSDVLQRTLAAAGALDAVDGGLVTIPLPNGRSATERSGTIPPDAPGLAGPPDGSPFVSGTASWVTPAPGGVRSGLVVPLAGGTVGVYSTLADAFDAEAASVLTAIARRAEPAIANALRYLDAEQRAATDLLTGLGSASAFAAALPREIAAARRSNRPLCLIQIDLDDFGEINRRHPRLQAAGDDALAGFGERVRSTIRESDSAFRNSGGADEFFILLPETSLADAKRSYARLQADMAAAPFGDVEPVTMSSGLVQWRPDESPESLKQRSNTLVSIAKRKKNRLVSEDDPEAQGH
jgi:diguanylate cyclase (GGDEF)-like protein